MAERGGEEGFHGDCAVRQSVCEKASLRLGEGGHGRITDVRCTSLDGPVASASGLTASRAVTVQSGHVLKGSQRGGLGKRAP